MKQLYMRSVLIQNTVIDSTDQKVPGNFFKAEQPYPKEWCCKACVSKEKRNVSHIAFDTPIVFGN